MTQESLHEIQLPACPIEKVHMSYGKHSPTEASMPPVQGRFLSIFIVTYHQSTFSPFQLQYINMTLKNTLQWENSRATVGLCCLINRDFKRQCRISMVPQGSAKGQARGVEARVGEGDRLLWTLAIHCVDTSTFQAQAGKQTLLSFTKTINTNQYGRVKQRPCIHHPKKATTSLTSISKY